MTSATFADALRSEWTKVRTLRSTACTLLGTVILAVGFATLFGLAVGKHYAASKPAERLTFDPTAISLRGYILAQLAIAVLGVLMITSEHATGMIHTSVAAVPRRRRLLAAKAAMFALVALATGELVGFGAFLVGQWVIAGQGAPHATLGQPDVLRAVVGAGLYLAVVGLLGVAVGTLTRATAGGLAIMVAITILAPALIAVLPDPVSRVLGVWWPTLAGRQILAVYQDPHLLSPWAGFGVLCGFVAAVLAAAFVVFQRRDL